MAMSINVQSFYQYGVQPVPQGRTRFRQGVSTFLETNRTGDRVDIDYKDTPGLEMRVTKSGETVKVDRVGIDTDVTFRKSGQNIQVDRYGHYADLNVLRDENSIRLDRPGFDSDVSANFSESAIEIRNPDSHPTTTLRRQGEDVQVYQHGFLVESFPVSVFPGGWPAQPSLLAISDYIGMPAQTADALDRWSAGGVDIDDLVRVDKYAQVTTYDDYFV